MKDIASYPTPETDAEHEVAKSCGFPLMVQADFARKLERRLAAEKEEHGETRKDYECLASQLDGHDATECVENLKELKRRLAACCETLAEVELYIPLPERLLNRVRETLAATASPFPSSGSGGDQVPVIATSK